MNAIVQALKSEELEPRNIKRQSVDVLGRNDEGVGCAVQGIRRKEKQGAVSGSKRE